MNIRKKLGYILAAESLALTVLLMSLVFFDYSAQQVKYVWEVAPAILAAMITTYGLKKMSSLT